MMIKKADIVNRQWSVRAQWLAINYLLLTLLAVPSFAAFDDLGTGARATGLGGAYTALGDETLSLFYNPAGLARLQQAEVATEYSRLYTGLSDNSKLGQYVLGGSIPLGPGSLSAGWKQLNLTDLYQERTVSVGYGRWFGPRIAFGAALKQLHHSYTAPTTTVDDNGNIVQGTPSLFRDEGTAKAALSGDAGLLYRLGRYQWLGFSVRNVNQPNVALDSNDTDRVRRAWNFGWAFQNTRRLSIAAEVESQECDCGPDDRSLTGALEKGWELQRNSTVFVRGAYTMGTRDLRQVSSGFGIRSGGLELHYAFVFGITGVAIGNTMGSHRFSASYRFDVQSGHIGPVGTIPPNLTPAPKPAPETSIMDIPSKDWDVLPQDDFQ